MTDRTAIDTIKGYFYQFDLTILKLLELSKEFEEITIEGIEDIDVKKANEETAVQCKYHAKMEYNHSVIAKPIRLMLNHFKEVQEGNQKKVKYLYYGHFKSGQTKLTLPLTIDFLKSNLLTYKKDKVEHRYHEELNLTDLQLEKFLNELTIDINAKDYNEQLDEIFNQLKKQIGGNCDDFEVESFYYNNALKVISNLAKEDNILNRKINKKDFLYKINSKQVLFHKWFIQFKGKKKFLLDLRNEYFSQYNISPFERLFLIEVNLSNYNKSELKDIIHLISEKWSGVRSKRNPDTFCPYIYIKGLTTTELIDLKVELSSEDFKFKDGFDFSGSNFNVISILEKATFYNQIRIKIINELSYIDDVLTKITNTKEVYQFYIDIPYFITNNSRVKHISIQIEDINDIKSII